MNFDFIDNTPVDESRRPDVIKQFVDFIDKTLSSMSAEEAKTDFATTSTKSLDAKNGDLKVSVRKRFYKNKPTNSDEPPFEDTQYEIDLNVSHFSETGTTIHSETYTYSKNNDIIGIKCISIIGEINLWLARNLTLIHQRA